MKINGNLVFNTDATGEIQNAYLERRASAPALNLSEAGRLYYNTQDGLYFFNDGTAWVPFATGGNAAALQQEVDNIEATLGAGIQGDGTIGTFSADVIAVAGGTPTNWTQVINALALKAQSTDTLAELGDVTLGTLASGQVLYYNGTKWANALPGATSGAQAHDAGLDSLSSMTGAGYVTVSEDGNTFVARTFQMPAEGIAMTNTSGGGNSAITLTNDLAAVEGLTGSGIAVRTGADTWAVRTISGGNTGTIVVGNGGGVIGDPTLDLQTLTIATNVGNFLKFTYDTHGRVTGVNAVTTSDITGLVDATYVNVSGDTMTGSLTMSGAGTQIILPNAPTDGTHATNKNYVDSLVAGLSWKQAVRVATVDDIDLASAPAAIDGVTLANGDRVLVKDQSAAAANGIYVFNGAGSAMTRSLDMNEASEFFHAAVFVTEGTQANTGWTEVSQVTTVGLDHVEWDQFTGAAQLVAGSGLDISGNTFSVKFGAGIKQLPENEVGVHIHNYAGSALGFHNGTGRAAEEAVAASGDTLALFLDGSTLGQSSSGLKVAAGGITEVEINSSALDANAGITGGSGNKLALNVNTSHLEVLTNILTIKDSGVTTAKIADSNVTNVKLQHSTISLTDGTTTDAVALGETITVSGSNGITTTVSANAVGVALSAALTNLSDVTITSPVAGNTLVHNGTAFVNRPTYFLYQAGSANTSHAITHNLGQQYCNVTVVDASDEVIIPQSITFNSVNQLTVTFTSALQCKVVIMGVNSAA